MRDYYDVLGVSAGAGADEIKRAYRQLTHRYHPDISGGDRGAVFLEVSRAHTVLRQLRTRRPFDANVCESDDGPASKATCFADEVAIDFPSVSSVLDNMRHAFFGAASGAPFAADLVLSPHEAFFGALVTLRLPCRRTCHDCGGRGEVWPDGCLACDGDGDVAAGHEIGVRVPAGVREGARFRFSVAPNDAAATLVEIRISIR